MRQTNICQVSTHLEIHFILRAERKKELSFFLRIEADQPDSYNISRVLITEKWWSEMALVKEGDENIQDFAKRFLKAI